MYISMSRTSPWRTGVVAGIFCLLQATPLVASDNTVPSVNGADTAWMIVATALVLFMTLPGLALFYGGLVRSKNVLSVLVQCLGWVSASVYACEFGHSHQMRLDVPF